MSIIKNKITPVFVKIVLRMVLFAYSLVIAVLPKKRRKNFEKDELVTVLLTGTFYSENWIMNHLRPIAECSSCRKVFVVTTFPIPPTEKVEIIYPSEKLVRRIGKVPARLLTFVLKAFRLRPDYIGGFHLLLNGLLSGLCARLSGANSIYFCGGGPREVLDGGIHGSKLFGLMKTPDKYLERKLIAAVGTLDHVITMGHRTVDFFKAHGVRTNFSVIPGGIPKPDNYLKNSEKIYDIIFVGRLEQVKRLDLLLGAIKIISDEIPELKAVLVGTGSLENELRLKVDTLNIQKNVEFAGFQRDVFPWLFKSKIFVITSDSEGLPLALMEAMTVGLPCVVSDVGELGEIVINGENGYLVRERNAHAFAIYLRELVINTKLYNAMVAAVNVTSKRFEVHYASEAWDKILCNSFLSGILIVE